MNTQIMPKLAVVMSVYKNDKLSFLKESVESILSQSYSDFHLYIKKDGLLPSETNFYLDSLTDNRIIILQRDINKGLAKTLNELLEDVLQKKYEYIARMDADDISMPERFQKQLRYMEENPKTECLGTWAIEILESGEEYFRKKMPLTHDDCFRFFAKRSCMIHPSVMFRRSFFEKTGLYPEDTYFSEDTLMWANGFKNNCYFSNIPEFLLKFRLDNNFFKRRRGCKHAKSTLLQRIHISNTLNYGIKGYFYAFCFALVKLCPTKILDLLYKTVR